MRPLCILIVALAAACGGGGGELELDTILTSVPADPVYEGADVVFRFTSTVPGATFQARVDGGAFVAAASPHTVAGLARGAHVFEVRAVRPDGRTDPTPARYEWDILPPLDFRPPALAIDFPPPHCATDADTIALRGTASDENGVVALSVDGVTVASGNGAVAWSTEVALQPGANDLRVLATDPSGNAAVMHISVLRLGPYLLRPLPPVLDAPRGRLIVLDDMRDALVAVDVATGERRILNTDWGAETRFAPRPLALDAAGDRVFVLHYEGAVSAVDLATGQRTEVIERTATRAAGVWLPQGIAYDAAQDRLFVSDFLDSAVFEIDLATGDHRIAYSGAENDVHGDIVWDPVRDRIVAGDRAAHVLVAIDPVTGTRTALPGVILDPYSLSLDATNDRVLAMGDTHIGLAKFALDTGGFDSFSVLNLPGGANRRGGIAASADGARAYITHPVQNAVYEVVLAGSHKDCTPVSVESVGPGLPLGGVEHIGANGAVFDAARDRTLLAMRVAFWGTFAYPAVFAVDRATGRRSVVSSQDRLHDENSQVIEPRGTGPEFERITDLAMDVARDRILVLDDPAGALFAVDPVTGDRTILASDPGARWVLMTVDAAGDRALVLDGDGRVLAVDLATGAFAEAADLTATVQTLGVYRIAYGRGTLYAVTTREEVFAIDLVTGAYSMVGEVPESFRQLVVDEAGDRLLTLHDDGLYAMDTTVGIAERLGDPGGRLGEFPQVPRVFCLDAARRCVSVVPHGDGSSVRALFRFDLETGACVIASKE